MEDFKFHKEVDIRLYRKLIIVRLSEKGLTQSEIADVVGCTQGLVSQVLQAYDEGGFDSLKSQVSSGAPSRLSQQDKEALKQHLTKGAKAYGFQDDLWTRKRVSVVIAQEFEVQYTLQHISNILAEVGYTLQKPTTKAPRKDEEKVKQWKEEELPKLKKEAEKHGKVIFYADEASFFLNPLFYRTYAPKGCPPVVPIWDKSFNHLCVCSAISNEGDFVYTMNDNHYTGQTIVEFLKELLAQIPQPIILIWDGASIHYCKAVKAFLDTLEPGRLKLVIQPSYSPELNADEQVWNYIKNVDLKNCIFKSLPQLKRKLNQVLDTFSNRANLIMQFFKHPSVAFY